MLNAQRINQLSKLLTKIGLKLDKYDLLNTALTHPSYVFEKGPQAGNHNQRLEFLGDAVVGLIVGDYLYHLFPEKTEGELTKMRAAVVCESSLAKAANRLGIGQYLLMGKGEKIGGGAQRPSNLADAWEAVVGALYIELGLEAIREFTLKYLKPEIEKVINGNYGDYKTQFQELVQKQPDNVIEYQIISESGPDHEKEFVAGIFQDGKLVSQGRGRTKKEAEQNAAHRALVKMGEISE
ncbi:MAG: ribonuclease [Clostridia bacterium]|nr:ribonuclease [Clostridia bacterium]MDN5322758.1 ribonuclease [Clostridia bacterium]